MKYFLKLLIVLPILFSACNGTQSQNAQSSLPENKLSTDLINNPRSIDVNDSSANVLGTLKFDDTIHQFGIIKDGEIVECEFEMTNIGQKDIFINEAKTSCGCTVPNYPTAPIQPGQKETIKVKFDSKNKVGYNEKTIDVITNGNPSIYHLYIQAQVDK